MISVLRDGTFTASIDGKALSRGLRSSKRSPRNEKFLVEAAGMVGIDGVLQAIDDLEVDRIDTSADILDAFPYPQIFVFTNVIIVCGRQEIFEWDGTTLTSMISALTAGQLWSAVSFYEFIYMSNGAVSVLRDPGTGLYALTTDQPVAMAIGDYNGQVMVGGLV
jgi:hypothetical protein